LIFLSEVGAVLDQIQAPVHKKNLLPFLGMVCGVGVSSIYLNQPLLLEISKTFHASHQETGYVAVATQVGYALGLFFFVPLGDVLERRRLISWMFAGVTLSMVLSWLAPTLSILILASCILGLTASVTHVALPIAPDLAEDGQHGRAIGIVMTGLLVGILLARAFSGGIASWLGWRAVFAIAAVVNAAFVVLLRIQLPELHPANKVRYGAALRSLWTLFWQQRVLREASVQSALLFGSFIGFWTMLTFLLGTPHFNLGSGVAGLFGVIGIVGAMVAPLAGRWSDRFGSRCVISLALGLIALAWIILWSGQWFFWGLILGCIVLDAGAQFNQIANQTRIFTLMEGARSRINTIYMTSYFVGAALGSYLANLGWTHFQWNGVVGVGFVFLIAAAAVHFLGGLRKDEPEALAEGGITILG
jgi:predicted MFS family arabinose efflux permease